MVSQSDVKVIEGGKVKQKRSFTNSDWDHMATYVTDTWSTRKNDRSDREKHWAEIDRQIKMTPNVDFKMLSNGQPDSDKMWMAEMETPLQAQALEVLTADARRLMFPSNEPWFQAHSEVTDDYLNNVDTSRIISGAENDLASAISQDNADALVSAFVMNIFRQVDFHSRVDLINAEAFKYGTGIGRVRLESADRFVHESIGVLREKRRFPVVVPVSIKNLYLDPEPISAHSMQALSPAHILETTIKYSNLVIAANKGSREPNDPDGGWIPKNVAKVDPDNKNDTVTLLEMEGDIVIPRKTVRSMVIPGAIITVAVGAEGSKGVVRLRFRQDPNSSYMIFPYHHEHIDDPYASSPLEKGMPIAKAAADALNRWLDSSAIKAAPPVGYDRNDQQFAAEGGPVIHPFAQWATTEGVNVYDEIGGDPSSIAAALQMFFSMYGELSGVLPGRLGAQTKSHTTAFAKDAEIERGASRTVDYTSTAGRGPLTRLLPIIYTMGRKALRSNERVSFYVPDFHGWASVSRKELPENVSFEWSGAAGPAEAAAIQASRAQSFQLALQIDQLQQAQGNQPILNAEAGIREILKQGQWADVDAVIAVDTPTPGNQAAPGIPGDVEPNPGLASTALQTLAFGGQS